MAARKKANPATSTSTNVLKTKRVISKNKNVRKGVKAGKPSARDMTRGRSKRTWEVVKLPNGLLDMSVTPPWLLKTVQRNATASPLLRLPGDIRTQIWRHAMTGTIINIREDEDETRLDAETLEKVLVVCKGHAVGLIGSANPLRWLSTAAEEKPRLPTAFHLPEVCRQIYAEAATLAYAGCIFFPCSWDDEGELLREWTSLLAPAHRAAIADLALDEMNFDWYLDQRKKLRGMFPGLRRLHLNTNRVNTVFDQGYDEEDRRFWKRELKRLEERKQKRVDRREGGGVRLVWHADPVKEYEMWEDVRD